VFDNRLFVPAPDCAHYQGLAFLVQKKAAVKFLERSLVDATHGGSQLLARVELVVLPVKLGPVAVGAGMAIRVPNKAADIMNAFIAPPYYSAARGFMICAGFSVCNAPSY